MLLHRAYSNLTRRASKLTLASFALLLLVTVGVLVIARGYTPAHTKQLSKSEQATEAKVAKASELAANDDSLPESSLSQQTTPAPQSQAASGAIVPAPKYTSPPFITATTVILDTTQAFSPTCEFTAFMTASALYHSNQSPYANHVVSFTLTLQASDGSASYSQTFSSTFAHGETKEFRLSRSFNKPTSEYTYQVKANGTMAVQSGSASLGPSSVYNATGSCGPRSPSP